ncbi:hypothetical protein ACTXT7_013947 [Hymenolepis weldensis]
MYRLLPIPTFCRLTSVAAGEVYSWHQIRPYPKATVISTWPWKGPNDAAWRNLDHPSGSAVSAVVAGCTAAEEDKSIPMVGAGSSPDENANTTLSAMVMDGDSMNITNILKVRIYCCNARVSGSCRPLDTTRSPEAQMWRDKTCGIANGKSIVVPWADLYRPSYKPIVVINTWPLLEPARSAFQVLQRGGSPLEAVVVGCTVAEADPNVTSVGYGGSPDEMGNTTLNAMVMDGDSMNSMEGVVSVADLSPFQLLILTTEQDREKRGCWLESFFENREKAPKDVCGCCNVGWI